MNQQLQDFARDELKKGLSKCSEAQQHLFKRMYSHNDLDASIDDIVNGMSEEKLDWAMRQVQSTIEKNAKNE